MKKLFKAKKTKEENNKIDIDTTEKRKRGRPRKEKIKREVGIRGHKSKELDYKNQNVKFIENKVREIREEIIEPKLEQREEISKPKFTDLRQVMDYKRNLSIFFSGVENESNLDILYELGIKNFLMSYHYLRGKGSKQFKKYPDMHLFIDSGAYTYMNDPMYEDFTVQEWENQIVKYLYWAEKHKDQIFAIADLDLQYLVGEEKVFEWRKKYFEPFMLRTGIPVCFIYHEEGLDVWEYMCKRYPYVGFSLNVDGGSIDFAELNERFKIAEKYGALVQGMATTRTSILAEYPFYTVDSTSWNVGLQFGEINVWRGNKMGRVKKQDFYSKAIPIISQYDVPFDAELILAEDTREMVRVNAYAFILAEKYVHERLKSKMYWQKAKTSKIKISEMPDDFFPPLGWLQNDSSEGLEEYARKFNINPELEPNELKEIIIDATVFLNFKNPLYAPIVEWYKKEEQRPLIDDLHDQYINRIVPEFNDKIKDLAKFFRDCIEGREDRLLLKGTNFDRTIKERDSYIEEELETEEIELGEEELKVKLYGLLPEPKDGENEQEELDEVLKDLDIVAIRDEKGRLIKGLSTVKKPKQLYSKKYPKFACDTCASATRCPEFRAGYVCAFSKMFERYDTRDMTDIINAMQGMVGYNLVRMQKAMIDERTGGMVDGTVTSLIDQNMRYLSQLKEMYSHSSAEVLRQTRIVRSDGSEETEVEYTNPQRGSILERLFSDVQGKGMNNNDGVEDNSDYVEVERIDEELSEKENKKAKKKLIEQED